MNEAVAETGSVVVPVLFDPTALDSALKKLFSTETIGFFCSARFFTIILGLQKRNASIENQFQT